MDLGFHLIGGNSFKTSLVKGVLQTLQKTGYAKLTGEQLQNCSKLRFTDRKVIFEQFRNGLFILNMIEMLSHPSFFGDFDKAFDMIKKVLGCKIDKEQDTGTVNKKKKSRKRTKIEPEQEQNETFQTPEQLSGSKKAPIVESDSHPKHEDEKNQTISNSFRLKPSEEVSKKEEGFELAFYNAILVHSEDKKMTHIQVKREETEMCEHQMSLPKLGISTATPEDEEPRVGDENQQRVSDYEIEGESQPLWNALVDSFLYYISKKWDVRQLKREAEDRIQVKQEYQSAPNSPRSRA